MLPTRHHGGRVVRSGVSGKHLNVAKHQPGILLGRRGHESTWDCSRHRCRPSGAKGLCQENRKGALACAKTLSNKGRDVQTLHHDDHDQCVGILSTSPAAYNFAGSGSVQPGRRVELSLAGNSQTTYGAVRRPAPEQRISDVTRQFTAIADREYVARRPMAGIKALGATAGGRRQRAPVQEGSATWPHGRFCKAREY